MVGQTPVFSESSHASSSSAAASVSASVSHKHMEDEHELHFDSIYDNDEYEDAQQEEYLKQYHLAAQKGAAAALQDVEVDYNDDDGDDDQDPYTRPMRWYETRVARGCFYLMGILYMFPWATVFFIVAALSVVEVQQGGGSGSHPATHTNLSLRYQHSLELDPKLFLYWNNPTRVGNEVVQPLTVDMHLVYYGNGWMALGVTQDDALASMGEASFDHVTEFDHADAVVGLPLEPHKPVQLYSVTSSTFGATTMRPKPQKVQTFALSHLNLVQSSTKTEMSFRRLVDSSTAAMSNEFVHMNAVGNTTLLYAYGSSNALGGALSSGVATLDFDYYAKMQSGGMQQDLLGGTNAADGERDGTIDRTDVTGNASVAAPLPKTPPPPGCAPSLDPEYDYTVYPTNHEEEMFFSYKLDKEAGMFHGKVAYHKPDRWIGWGIQPLGNAQMIGSKAIIGIPGGSAPAIYSMDSKDKAGIDVLIPSYQTLILPQTSMRVDEELSTTVMTFSQSVADFERVFGISLEAASSPPANIVWAVGEGASLAFHAHRGSFSIDLSTCAKTDKIVEALVEDIPPLPQEQEKQKQALAAKPVPTGKSPMKLLYTHAVLMTLAWLVVTPISISFGFLRHMTALKANWFYIHMGLNLLGWILSSVAFFCIVSAVNIGNASHFRTTHQIVGLVMMVLITFQVVGALCRPARTTQDEYLTGFGGSYEEESPIKIVTTQRRFKSFSSMMHKTFGSCDSRQLWQKTHEYTGILLLLLGLIQVYDGMNKLMYSYGVGWRVDALFWIFCLPWLTILGSMLYIQHVQVRQEQAAMLRNDILPEESCNLSEDDDDEDAHSGRKKSVWMI